MSIPLGPFVLHEPIARGGMAQVWRGEHPGQGVPVAVKVMTGDLSRHDSYRAQFRNEVRAQARLHHPGVALVLDYGEIGAVTERADSRLVRGSPYIVMEWVSGGSLSSLRQPMRWPELRTTLAAVLDALAHGHARGVIHRDVKPGNVLIGAPTDPRPGLKLTDFGIAHGYDLVPTRDLDQDRSGTLHYMAPEQLRGQWRDQGPWTDLYAVGCLAWRLAIGIPPFGGRRGDAVLRGQLEESPFPFEPEEPVPEGFELWLARMLEKEPRMRFRGAADAHQALFDLGEVAPPRRKPLSVDDDSTLAFRPWRPGPPKISPDWRRAPAPPAPALVGAGLGLYNLRTPPFVGREAERDALWDALVRVHREGTCETVTITGPGGIGKSRLIEWIATRANEVGAANVLRSQPDRGATGSGLARMLERLVRCENLSRDEIRSRLLRVLDLGDWEIGALVDVAGPGASRTPAVERHAAMRALVAKLAQERPIVLWLDDAHLDDDARGLARLLHETREQLRIPVLVVLAVRTDDESTEPGFRLGGPGVREIPLGPLSFPESDALLHELLVLDEGVAAEIRTRTAGHPLFAVQLVGDLVHRGALRPGPAGFRLAPNTTPALPDSLHQVWASRIDRLVAERDGALPLLERAAVLGLEVDDAEWEAAATADLVVAGGRGVDVHDLTLVARVSDLVEELREVLLAQRLAEPTPRGWTFRHNLLRESLERSASDSGRLAGHHRAVADALSRNPDVRAYADRIGRHRLAAGEPERAIEPLLLACRLAARTVGSTSALDALRLTERAMLEARIPPTDARWGELYNERTDVWMRSGDLKRGLELSERTLTLARDNDWDAVYRQALALRGPALRFVVGADAAEPVHRELIELAARAGDDAQLAEGLLGLAFVAATRHDHDRATSLAEQSVALARNLGDDAAWANGLRAVGQFATSMGDLRRAREALEHAAALAEQEGARSMLGVTLIGLGTVHRLAGKLDDAESTYERAGEILREVGSGNGMLVSFHLATMRWLRGHPDDALAMLLDLEQVVQARGWRRLVGGLRALEAACHAELGTWESFTDALADLEKRLENPDLADEDVAIPLERAGRTAAREGRVAEAKAAFRIAIDVWRAVGKPGNAEALRAELRRLRT